MKKLYLMALSFAMVFSSFSQTLPQAPASIEEARKDFQDKRFGLFIHWGIYSLLGANEWAMHNHKISYNNYSRLAGFFYPFAFNAKEWVDMAKAAG